MVGFLLALNAVLITTPERRRFTAEMRTLGFTRRYILVILAFPGDAPGGGGLGDGIGVGYVLFQTVFHSTPGFLASAFLVGSQQPFQIALVLLALVCGVLAALTASIPCVMDLRSDVADAVLREPGEAGQQVSRALTVRLALAGVALTAAISLAVTHRHRPDDRWRSAAGGGDPVLRAGRAQRRPVADWQAWRQPAQQRAAADGRRTLGDRHPFGGARPASSRSPCTAASPSAARATICCAAWTRRSSRSGALPTHG